MTPVPPSPNGPPPGLLPPPMPPPRRPVSLAPYSLQPAKAKSHAPLVGALVALVVLAAGALGAAAKLLAGRRPTALDEASVVRVVSGSSFGTGFFVAPPKGLGGV